MTRRSPSARIILFLLLAAFGAGAGSLVEAGPGQDVAPASRATQTLAARPTIGQLEQATISGIYDKPITLAGGVYEG